MSSSRPLNALDQRLLRLQTPTRPWLIQYCVSPGPDAAAIEQGIQQLGQRWPELTSRLSTDAVAWTDPTGRLGGSAPWSLDTPLDLRQSAIHVDVSLDGTVELLINHAFTDGLGGLAVVEELLAAMRATAPRERGAVTDRHFEQLQDARATDHLGAARTAAGVMLRPGRVCEVGGSSHVADVQLQIDAIDRHRQGAWSLNDVLVAAAHCALAQVLPGTSPTRVSVPMDLRRHIGSPGGLGNAVVNATTRVARKTASLRDAAHSVSEQIAHQRTPERLRAQFDQALRVLPTGGPRMKDRRVQRPLWRETAVCSNLGRVEHLGDVALTFSPPAHELLSIGLVGCGDNVTARLRGRVSPVLLKTIADAYEAILDQK